MAQPLLFLHGGPGLNAFAEERMLGPTLEGASYAPRFWHEPSAGRPSGWPFRADGGYSSCVESAAAALGEMFGSHGPVHVMAHSFGAAIAMDLARRRADRISRITMIAPSTVPSAAHRRIFGLAARDLRVAAPDQAQRLLELAAASQALFDGPAQEAFQIVAGDPDLFTNYWWDKAAMQSFFGIWQELGLQLDVESFLAVMRDFAQQSASRTARVEVPVRAVFTPDDPVIDRTVEVESLGATCRDFRWRELAGHGHFPHLEAPKEFLREVSDLWRQ